MRSDGNNEYATVYLLFVQNGFIRSEANLRPGSKDSRRLRIEPAWSDWSDDGRSIHPGKNPLDGAQPSLDAGRIVGTGSRFCNFHRRIGCGRIKFAGHDAARPADK